MQFQGQSFLLKSADPFFVCLFWVFQESLGDSLGILEMVTEVTDGVSQVLEGVTAVLLSFQESLGGFMSYYRGSKSFKVFQESFWPSHSNWWYSYSSWRNYGLLERGPRILEDVLEVLGASKVVLVNVVRVCEDVLGVLQGIQESWKGYKVYMRETPELFRGSKSSRRVPEVIVEFKGHWKKSKKFQI